MIRKIEWMSIPSHHYYAAVCLDDFDESWEDRNSPVSIVSREFPFTVIDNEFDVMAYDSSTFSTKSLTCEQGSVYLGALNETACGYRDSIPRPAGHPLDGIWLKIKPSQLGLVNGLIEHLGGFDIDKDDSYCDGDIEEINKHPDKEITYLLSGGAVTLYTDVCVLDENNKTSLKELLQLVLAKETNE